MKLRKAALLLLVGMTVLSAATDLRPGRVKEKLKVEPATRIIGGTNAPEGRYPYMVSLLNSDGVHSCGGSLVAPDVVLTAAHCRDVLKYAQIGRHDRLNPGETYEQFEILQPEYVHPQYDEEEFPFDFMFLKLSGQSRKQYILVNDDNNLPSAQDNDELTVLGFGITEPGEPESEARILQEVKVAYIPNDICEKAKDPRIGEDYQGLISSDMLCASDSGEDACQGDSGGPLVVGREYAQRDILVGIVSWGYGCALPAFPGVYSRISHQIDWIRSTLCRISSLPPPEIDCTLISNMEGEFRSVPVTIILQFDDYPMEIGWSVMDKETETILVEVAAGTYDVVQAQVPETVFLPVGSAYVFEIEDTFGDGLCCTTPGNYVVMLGRNPNGEVLITGGGDFGRREQHEFDIPLDFVEPSEDDFELIIGEGQVPLTIVIQLDNYPQEGTYPMVVQRQLTLSFNLSSASSSYGASVGWRVDRLGLEVEEILRIPAGIYVTPFAKVTRTLVLEEGELYYFRIYDVMEDGIGAGYVQLILGAADGGDEGTVILKESGQFGGGVDISFVASLGVEPTAAPVGLSENFLTLELRFDQYPEEIALQLRVSDSETSLERERSGTVIFFRPPRFYADYVDQTVVEVIPTPQINPGASRQFTFIVTDSYGDGLCCNWAGSTESGYTLYKGEKEENVVLASSRFEASAREITTFTIEATHMGAPRPSPGEDTTESPIIPLPTAEIKVTITLDTYPDETGFYILNEFGTRVVDFPPGTYREPTKVVEEVISVEVGVYTFAIVDVFGDGLNLDDGYYSISLKGESNRPPLLTGSASFGAEEMQTFAVEGSAATYPLNIRFYTDLKPKEIGFFVQRIDIPQYDALIASVPQGSYVTKNQEVRESILLSDGGLYRIVFEDAGQNGIGGLISVSHGKGSGAKEFSVDANLFHEMRIKVFAGELPPTSKESKHLSLRFWFDRFPHEIEWVLLWNELDPKNAAGVAHSLRNFQVLAFGPPGLYDQSLASGNFVESISLPAWAGEKNFILLVSDSAGDGVCCNFGVGGPIELYEGSVDQGTLLFSDALEGTARLMEAFSLVGNGTEAPSAACRSRTWPVVLFSVSIFIFFSLVDAAT